MARQASLPITAPVPDEVLRAIHRRLGLRCSFEAAMAWPTLRACLERSALRRGVQSSGRRPR